MRKYLAFGLNIATSRTLTLALLAFVGGFGSIGLAAEVPRCTKSSVSCLDTKNQQARTCVTTTCTYADGHSTTSVTVELTNSHGGHKPLVGGSKVTGTSKLGTSP